MSSQLPIPSERGYPALDGHNGAPLAGRMNGSPEPPQSAEQGVKRYIAAVFRYKWMILVIVALGTGAGFALASRQSQVYETRARVWVGSGLAGGQVGAPISQGQLLQPLGWQQLLRSSAVLDTVVLQHRLFLTPTRRADSVAFAGFHARRSVVPGTYSLVVDGAQRTFVLSDASGATLQRGRLGEPVGAALGFDWTPDPSVLPANRPLEFKVAAPGDVVSQISTQLSATDPAKENFMNLRLRGTDPQWIAAVLHAIVERFEQVSVELKRTRLTENAKILDTQLKAAEQALAQAEGELQSYQVETITLPAEPGTPINPGLAQTDNSALGNYWRMTTEKDQLTRDREAIRRALETRDADVSIVTALEVIPSVRQRSSELGHALNEATAADATLRTLKQQYTDLHPLVQTQQQHLDSLVAHVIPQYSRNLMLQLGAAERDVDELIGSSARELRQIPERSIHQTKLSRRVAIADQQYRYLETQYQNARLAELTTVPDITVLDWPAAPYMPMRDERLRLLLMCMGGSLGLALLGAIVRDRLDSRLRYPDEVTGGMGLHILGAVPALRRGNLGATDMALAVEAFRAIQLSVLHAHGAEAPLVVTLTSPGPSDGKSFVSSNLAIAFADMGHRTLIIDGDVRRGTVHQLMGTTHKPGLTDFLADHATRAEIVQPTRYALLDMIGCGSRGEAGPKLLGSAAMTRLMNELREDYDIILVDSPPLGACVDPMILGTLTRNMLLVLRTGTTDRGMAESKLQVLDRLPVRVLGAVLNDVPARGAYRYYSYLSGYEVIDDVQEGQEVSALPAAEAVKADS